MAIWMAKTVIAVTKEAANCPALWPFFWDAAVVFPPRFNVSFNDILYYDVEVSDDVFKAWSRGLVKA